MQVVLVDNGRSERLGMEEFWTSLKCIRCGACMMKLAGELLSRPTAYRAAIAATDSALAHLPRFVIYNGLNAWGKHREVPHAPRRRFIAGIGRVAEKRQ
jgi:hypothetical protein